MNKESNRHRLTIDTSNVVSGTISPGNFSSQLLTRWMDGAFDWIEIPQTFHELQEVLLREKFRTNYHFQEAEIREFIEKLAVSVQFMPAFPVEQLPIRSRYEKDDKFLVCAIAGQCQFLITADEDLLILNGSPELGEIQIITAEAYIRKYP